MRLGRVFILSMSSFLLTSSMTVAQSNGIGCTNSPVIIMTGYCCGKPTGYVPSSSQGTYAYENNWTYCCGHSVIVGNVPGYCLNAKLRQPGALEKLWKAHPDGRLLVASCSGALIPLPRPKEWDPQKAFHADIELTPSTNAGSALGSGR